jgi:hypothetical protein
VYRVYNCIATVLCTICCFQHNFLRFNPNLIFSPGEWNSRGLLVLSRPETVHPNLWAWYGAYTVYTRCWEQDCCLSFFLSFLRAKTPSANWIWKSKKGRLSSTWHVAWEWHHGKSVWNMRDMSRIIAYKKMYCNVNENGIVKCMTSVW